MVDWNQQRRARVSGRFIELGQNRTAAPSICFGFGVEFQEWVMKMRLSVLFLSHRGEPILLLQVNDPPGQFRQPLVLGMVHHLFQRFFAVGSESIPQRVAHYTPAPVFVGTFASLPILTEKS